jgi:hypothetical protein
MVACEAADGWMHASLQSVEDSRRQRAAGSGGVCGCGAGPCAALGVLRVLRCLVCGDRLLSLSRWRNDSA